MLEEDLKDNSKRSEYLKLIELHNTNRIDYNTRKWGTVKFFQGIFAALMSASLIAMASYAKVEQVEEIAPTGEVIKRTVQRMGEEVGIVITLLPIASLVSLYYGFQNLKRESELLFYEEAQIFKLARLLGLDGEVPLNQRWIKSDRYLFWEKWRSCKYESGLNDRDPCSLKQWVDHRLRNHRFVRYFKCLFIIEGVLAIIMACFIMFFIKYR